MELSRIGGKLRELFGSRLSLWLPLVRSWFESRNGPCRLCSFPGAERLIMVAAKDYYESYEFFCQSSGGRSELEAFTQTLREDDVMLDIGGYRGAYAMAAKARLSKIPIFIFEPVEANADRIREVIKLNEFRDISVREVAVGDDRTIHGSISIRDGMLRNVEGSTSERVQIPTCSLDRFVMETGATPTIIKLDVDGFELEVLKGAENCLRKHRPRLWIELHPMFLAERKLSVKNVTDLLESFGYALVSFADFDAPDRNVAYHVWALPTGPADGEMHQTSA